ncbi:nickel-dependent hydrogenase large subunit [Methanopyrus sp.]
MGKVEVRPLTRVEHHCELLLLEENGVVVGRNIERDGKLNHFDPEGRYPKYVVTDLRGIQEIAKGKEPEDVPKLVSRVCGPCSLAHCLASVQAVEDAYDTVLPTTAWKVRRFLCAIHTIQDHLLWSLLISRDFLPDTVVDDLYDQFVKYHGDAQALVAVFTGKPVHPASVCVGGYTGDVEKLSSLYSTVRSRLESMQSFLESVIPTFWKYLSAYLPDDVGDRPAHMISSGTPFYSGLTSGYVHPYLATSGGVLIADTKDQGSMERARLVPFYHDRVGKIKLARGSNLNERCYSYSEVGYYEWNGTKYACEAGPLARLAVAYKAGDKNVRWFLDSWSEKLDVEVWGLLKPCARNRNMARILEALLLTRLALHWIDDLPTTGSTYKDPSRRSGCFGTGVIEAPRGTLIHKVSIGSDGKVVGYEIITPTNLNHAPIEESMVGERVYIDEKLAAVKRQVSESERLLLGDACRAARSFNPCNSCASHTIVKVVKKGWTNSRSPR